MRQPIEFARELVAYIARIEPKREMTFEEFLADDDARDAVLYNFIIIGEIVKHLPPEVLQRHSDYDWSKVARFRARTSTPIKTRMTLSFGRHYVIRSSL